MASNVDIDQLTGALSRQDEKVVIVLPGREPMVLLPLAEYERMLGRAGAGQTNEARPSQLPPKPAVPAPPKLEAVDPPQGGLKDDDQYFPEPLD